MKLTILRLNTTNKPSPMSEGVVEIQINNQPCKGINLTIRHMWATKATRVATVHDEAKKSGWVLPHPSVVFHVYASADTPWVAQTLSHCTPAKWGKVLSNPLTHKATKVWGFLMSRMCQYIQVLVYQGSTDAGLNWHRRRLPPWSFEFQIRSLILLPIQYSPLSPNCPARSSIMSISQSSC
jgi:hypothetical protein